MANTNLTPMKLLTRLIIEVMFDVIGKFESFEYEY